MYNGKNVLFQRWWSLIPWAVFTTNFTKTKQKTNKQTNPSKNKQTNKQTKNVTLYIVMPDKHFMAIGRLIGLLYQIRLPNIMGTSYYENVVFNTDGIYCGTVHWIRLLRCIEIKKISDILDIIRNIQNIVNMRYFWYLKNPK